MKKPAEIKSRLETVFHFFLHFLLWVAEKEKTIRLLSTHQHFWKCPSEGRNLHLFSCLPVFLFLTRSHQGMPCENQCVGAVLLQSPRSLPEEEGQSFLWNATQVLNPQLLYTGPQGIYAELGFYNESFRNSLSYTGLLSMLCLLAMSFVPPFGMMLNQIRVLLLGLLLAHFPPFCGS